MTDAPAQNAATLLAGAPFFIGITGKRDLRGQDRRVREALDTAFEAIDHELPYTPKIVLSALAAGADTLAAEAALARPGWRVIAPLPFRADVYKTDFTEPRALDRLRRLLADPRVTVVELEPLLQPGSEKPHRPSDLRRAPDATPDRATHYEQLGLYIVERSALMIGVVRPRERAHRIGGAGRILQARLEGLDAVALDVRTRSVELRQDGGLADPRHGPVWRILLHPEGGDADAPLRRVVQAPHEDGVADAETVTAVSDSLELGRRIDEINRHAARAAGEAPAPTDALARIVWLRRGLSSVQQRMKMRVQRSVWLIATLFAAAVVSLETHAAFGHYDWSQRLGVPYFLCAAGAIGLYLAAGRGRWQPLAEDYRATSEALRVQMVLWQSGVSGPNSRVDLGYLRGRSGSVSMVRETVGQLIEGARMLHAADGPVAVNPAAAASWVEGQIKYFARRIGERRGAVDFSQGASWFLFAGGLVLSAGIAALQLEVVHRLAGRLLDAPWPHGARWVGLAVAILSVAAAFAVAQAAQRGARAPHGAGQASPAFRILGLGAAVFAGAATALGLFDIAALMPIPHGAGPETAARQAQAEELLIFTAVVATTLAGTIRFVSEKLSWDAELEGYEQALGFFRRARHSLTALDAAAHPTARQRQALVEALAAEAMRENESWLLAHRERPLEPVVGG